MTEMTRRSGVKVRASRESAAKLHSAECWEWMVKQDKPAAEDVSAVFHGVQPTYVRLLLDTLVEKGVTASIGSELDDAVRSIIQTLGIAEATTVNTSNRLLSDEETTKLQMQALEYSSSGNTQQLRQLSRQSHLIIPTAMNSSEQNCLHVASRWGHFDTCRWLTSEVNINPQSLDQNGKAALDLAKDGGHKKVVELLRSWIERNEASRSGQTSDNSTSSPGTDMYRHAEQQLRSIRTIEQLRGMLQINRSRTEDTNSITHVLGCTIEDRDLEENHLCEEELVKEHGAVILRNFVPRLVDQLALGVLALRPLGFDMKHASQNIGAVIESKSAVSSTKGEKKRSRKRIEDVKSQMTIAGDSSVIVQTNFGSELRSYTEYDSSTSPSSGNAAKKRRVESFPLSKLRYLNLGEWNYNWGDRKYEKISGALALPKRFVGLAQHAYDIAKQKTGNIETTKDSSTAFDMAICNLYHLQRPSDRVGGHQDNVEHDLSLPLVTISLGAPGIFLLGGNTKEDAPTAILLRAGDCMVLSGKSRRYFHGVPTILDYDYDSSIDTNVSMNHNDWQSMEIFPELKGSGLNDKEERGVPSREELSFMKAFLSTVRMNLSIRQIL